MPHGGYYQVSDHLHRGHPLFWLAVLALLVVACVFAVRALLRASGRTAGGHVAIAGWPPAHDAALDSVRLRYARGEIDRDEFARISTDLGAAPPAPPSNVPRTPGEG